MIIRSISALLLFSAISVAQAQTAPAPSACPADDPVSAVMTPGFACTLGDKTFSAFMISGAPADARIQFGILNRELFAVTLSRDGAFFPTGTDVFNYTITAASPNHILQGTVGYDVSFPFIASTTTMNGMSLTPNLLVNGGFASIDFSPGVGSVVVDNTAHVAAGAELNSISNDFAQVAIGVPEPPTLALFALGIAGLLICARRK
jgi:hypothetical protein